MDFLFDAACSSCGGRDLRVNEDNFFFDGKCLPEAHGSLPHPVTVLTPLKKERCVAVFGGVGPEGFGAKASFAAADCLREQTRLLSEYVIPERRFLREVTGKINESIAHVAREPGAERCGTAMAAMLFSHGFAYVCSLGDCRIFRVREGQFLQLSGEGTELTEQGFEAPAQYLGAGADSGVKPYIAKGELKHGDQYLLCTGALTDALSNVEIAGVLENTAGAEDCLRRLLDAAIQRAEGKSITAILTRIH